VYGFSAVAFKQFKRKIMALTAEDKGKVVADYKRSDTDTGSPEVQIALMTERITDLSPHFKEHIHDHHSRQGLLRLVSRRRKLLDYLKSKDIERYRDVIKRLGLRK
jgi:small subunit ribosomal protein S15